MQLCGERSGIVLALRLRDVPRSCDLHGDGLAHSFLGQQRTNWESRCFSCHVLKMWFRFGIEAGSAGADRSVGY